jgi:hypothetical protein
MDRSANRQCDLPIAFGDPRSQPSEVLALFARDDAVQAGVVALTATADATGEQRDETNTNKNPGQELRQATITT